MPTTQKTLMFLSGFLTSLGAVIVICSILGTQAWITSTIGITDSISNGSVTITYGLFRGRSTQEIDQGLKEPDKDFEVLGILNNSSQKTLHLLAILFLVLSFCTSLLSSGFTFYNSVSNPYQTFLGPMGVYTWNGLSASFIFLTMVLFVGNTQSNHLSGDLLEELYPTVTSRGTTHSYGYSFWLILLVILLNMVTVVIIVFYQKARYQQKQEQRKPMEYAPRDGILF
ncbi:Clarin-3 [Sciurus carolinensis]|uniref:Clarin-3 n=1 Tax=Sciurus carolinensis TaxID=30640 RepID=A0AA41NHY4_SCICA|nr:clarin-3 [Sciurus carolinensis]XP_047409441.1 clarin-3 [Sciurus carolinensis]MBZ3890677.1 Clarin-3 [Sciurus carolinensis]